MDQSWWFPAVAPLPGRRPAVMLAERSLPGSLIVDQNGDRFVNESTDYMSFGQRVLELERAGRPVEAMWIVFDQQYRNSYVFAAELFPAHGDSTQPGMTPGSPAVQTTLTELARADGRTRRTGSPTTMRRFNEAPRGRDRRRLPPRAERLRPLLRRPHHHPEPQPAPTRQGAVLRGQDGAQRPRHLRRTARRRPRAGAARGRHARSTGSTRSATPPPTPSAPRYPGAGATIAQGLVYGVHRRHGRCWSVTDRVSRSSSASACLLDLVPEFRCGPRHFAPSAPRRGTPPRPRRAL